MKKRITYRAPVKFGDLEVTSVTIRKPMCEDELAAGAANQSGTPGEQEMRLASILTGIPFDQLLKTDSAVYRTVQGPMLSFLASSPETSVEEISETGSGTSAAPLSS